MQKGSRERSSPVEEPLKSRCAGRLGQEGGGVKGNGEVMQGKQREEEMGEGRKKCGEEKQCIVSTRGPYAEVHVHSCHHVL